MTRKRLPTYSEVDELVGGEAKERQKAVHFLSMRVRRVERWVHFWGALALIMKAIFEFVFR